MTLKGKPLSLLSKLLALVFVLFCFCVNIFTDFKIPMNDVIKVAIFMALVFSPVDVSLWMEAFAGIRQRVENVPEENMPSSIPSEGPANDKA